MPLEGLSTDLRGSMVSNLIGASDGAPRDLLKTMRARATNDSGVFSERDFRVTLRKLGVTFTPRVMDAACTLATRQEAIPGTRRTRPVLSVDALEKALAPRLNAIDEAAHAHAASSVPPATRAQLRDAVDTTVRSPLEVFRRMDINRDGKIDEDEFIAGVRQTLKVNEAQMPDTDLEKAFAGVADDEGHVDFSSFDRLFGAEDGDRAARVASAVVAVGGARSGRRIRVLEESSASTLQDVHSLDEDGARRQHRVHPRSKAAMLGKAALLLSDHLVPRSRANGPAQGSFPSSMTLKRRFSRLREADRGELGYVSNGAVARAMAEATAGLHIPAAERAALAATLIRELSADPADPAAEVSFADFVRVVGVVENVADPARELVDAGVVSRSDARVASEPATLAPSAEPSSPAELEDIRKQLRKAISTVNATPAEVVRAFSAWDQRQSGRITAAQLRRGISSLGIRLPSHMLRRIPEAFGAGAPSFLDDGVVELQAIYEGLAGERGAARMSAVLEPAGLRRSSAEAYATNATNAADSSAIHHIIDQENAPESSPRRARGAGVSFRGDRLEGCAGIPSDVMADGTPALDAETTSSLVPAEAYARTGRMARRRGIEVSSTVGDILDLSNVEAHAFDDTRRPCTPQRRQLLEKQFGSHLDAAEGFIGGDSDRAEHRPMRRVDSPFARNNGALERLGEGATDRFDTPTRSTCQAPATDVLSLDSSMVAASPRPQRRMGSRPSDTDLVDWMLNTDI